MKTAARLLMILLCAALTLTAFAETEDPVIVRVGKVEYPLSLARYSYQSNLDMMAYQVLLMKSRMLMWWRLRLA